MPTKKKTIPTKVPLSKKASIFSQIKWGESYTSFVLGVIVILVGLILVVSFIKNAGTKQTSSTATKENISEQTNSLENNLNGNSSRYYTIKTGDTLWSIAESFYKSGYNFVDIVKANNLENPGLIHAGNKLLIPNVKPIVIEVNNQLQKTEIKTELNISGNSYTVVKGDNLWDIAVRAYGDGFKWSEIAKANNLTNPSLIFAGNILAIPR